MFDYKAYWHKRDFDYDDLKMIWREDISRVVENDSVLELGCGVGRMAPCFDPEGYLGVDINAGNIKKAKEKHPIYKFEAQDINEWDFPEKDWIFTWTTLELVPPELMPALVEKIKKAARKGIVLCEPKFGSVEINVDYCFLHDYEKLFNVVSCEPIDGIVYMHIAEEK